MSDLAAILPQLLPAAIAWAETKSREVALEGRKLDALETEVALTVGVKQPQLVSVLLVTELPLPADHDLKVAAIGTGLLGPNMVGLTLGHSIYVVNGHMSRRLLSHELRHVHQYEIHGSIANFLPIYLEQIASVGYANAPLEIDARNNEIG